MLKIVLFSVIILVGVLVVFVGGTILITYWRNTLRKWRLEKARDEIRLIAEKAEAHRLAAREMDALYDREKTRSR